VRDRSLGDCYRLIDELIPVALESSAHLLMTEEVPLTRESLARVQAELRRKARQWAPSLTSRFGGGEGKLRTAMKNKGEQLAELLHAVPDLEDRPFWTAAETLGLLDAVIRDLNSGTVRPSQDAKALHDYADFQVSKLDLVGNTSEAIVGEVTDVVTRMRRRVGQITQDPTLHAAFDTKIIAEIGAPVMAAFQSRDPSTPDAKRLIHAWVVTRLVSVAARRLFGLDVLCEFYNPVAVGGLEVAASSMERVPGPPPSGYASRRLLKGQLQGGIAVLTGVVVFNDFPISYTNSFHNEEGSPTRTMSISLNVRPNGGERGQLFVGVRDKDAPPLRELPAFTGLVLCAAQWLEEELTGEVPRFRFLNYLSETLDPDDFRNRLHAEVWRNDYETPRSPSLRTGLVVVSGDASEIPRNRRATVERLLDQWARSTALRQARGQPVYRLKRPGAYAFVERDMDLTEWRRFRDEGPLGAARRHMAISQDGAPAGFIATWTCAWRHDILLNARGALGTRLEKLMENQVNTASEAVGDLNDLFEFSRRGDYGRGITAAKRVILRGKDCGVAANDLARLYILRGDFKAALDYSSARKGSSGWDAEAHINFLLALLGLGDLGGAAQELNDCALCSGYQKGLIEKLDSERWSFPMLGLLLGFTQATTVGSPAMQFDLRAQIESCLEPLAPETDYKRDVRRCVDDTLAFVAGQVVASPEARLSDLLLGLEEAGDGPRRLSRLPSQIEPLKAIIVSLRGLVRNYNRDAVVEALSE